MLNITHASPNRLDLYVEGQIDAEEMRDGLNALFAASTEIEDGVMYYEIGDVSVPTAGAIMVELGQLPKLLSLVGKFRRCAVLSDAAWVRKVAEIEGALFPGLTIQSFERGDRDAAEAWLAED
ncbi:MAG: STAS/SEC14 domain-containing protein [Pseudomonadota bacterium]